MPDLITVAVAYHSGYGHTARQARAAADGARSVSGVRAELHDVTSLTDGLWEGLSGAEAIIFGSPTYMGSQSAAFQAFAEASAKIWVDMGWRDKVAAGFTNSAGVNGDKLNTLTSMALLAAQHGMTWVTLGLPPGWLYSADGRDDDLNRLGGFLGAMAQSPSDAGPETAPSLADLRTAEHLGRRVAQTALRLASGRRALDGTAA
ncbi:FMN reductase [Planomonospora parontospora subsp. parontospora]|uniref:FMN reductase n=2 Tax=Planomonospora parontospora TaxID=58119 RepID=A0AA37BK82_9ACTN|nr:flavodoxin family protein [Planomonospora parontospora]GGK81529.1 FMN reductase [Planomonospora parontospora]GII11058.1 FMN reductase [Planomonospora parontospora subsp. parontospora]